MQLPVEETLAQQTLAQQTLAQPTLAQQTSAQPLPLPLRLLVRLLSHEALKVRLSAVSLLQNVRAAEVDATDAADAIGRVRSMIAGCGGSFRDGGSVGGGKSVGGGGSEFCRAALLAMPRLLELLVEPVDALLQVVGDGAREV